LRDPGGSIQNLSPAKSSLEIFDPYNNSYRRLSADGAWLRDLVFTDREQPVHSGDVPSAGSFFGRHFLDRNFLDIGRLAAHRTRMGEKG
jgi:hypothetical protein